MQWFSFATPMADPLPTVPDFGKFTMADAQFISWEDCIAASAIWIDEPSCPASQPPLEAPTPATSLFQSSLAPTTKLLRSVIPSRKVTPKELPSTEA